MLTRTNAEIVSNDRNIEQSNTEWTTREKKFIGLSILIFWLVIVSGIVCYITFCEEEIQHMAFNNERLNGTEVCQNLIKEDLAVCIERVEIANRLRDWKVTVQHLQKF